MLQNALESSFWKITLKIWDPLFLCSIFLVSLFWAYFVFWHFCQFLNLFWSPFPLEYNHMTLSLPEFVKFHFTGLGHILRSVHGFRFYHNDFEIRIWKSKLKSCVYQAPKFTKWKFSILLFFINRAWFQRFITLVNQSRLFSNFYSFIRIKVWVWSPDKYWAFRYPRIIF